VSETSGIGHAVTIRAFTVEQVCHLTGLKPGSLRYWDQTGFFSPSVLDTPGVPYGRIYSLRDVVGLRVIAILRKRYEVPLQELRRVGAWLHNHYEEPWSALRFYVGGRKIFFEDPDTLEVIAGRPMGQSAFPIEMERVAREVNEAVRAMRTRSEDQIGQIQQRRHIVHNTPVVAGTRVPAADIWQFHDAGYTPDQIIREFPTLTIRDVEAAIAYEANRQREVEQRRTRRRAG
jgi:uncharacterized protein (DUF433 family)